MQRSLRSVCPGLAWLGQPLSQLATPPPHATHATTQPYLTATPNQTTHHRTLLSALVKSRHPLNFAHSFRAFYVGQGHDERTKLWTQQEEQSEHKE